MWSLLWHPFWSLPTKNRPRATWRPKVLNWVDFHNSSDQTSIPEMSARTYFVRSKIACDSKTKKIRKSTQNHYMKAFCPKPVHPECFPSVGPGPVMWSRHNNLNRVAIQSVHEDKAGVTKSPDSENPEIPCRPASNARISTVLAEFFIQMHSSSRLEQITSPEGSSFLCWAFGRMGRSESHVTC